MAQEEHGINNAMPAVTELEPHNYKTKFFRNESMQNIAVDLL